ncbi:MAG: hypothetical protein IPK19_12215 [Chloroflexi bacterium]|nr:hypothetical protein [Chloroflexota bacterium]
MKRTIVLWACLVLLAVFPISAQEAADPVSGNGLLELLRYIPDSPEAVSPLLSYVDYRALEASRAGAAQPDSWVEWDRLNGANDDSAEYWMAAFMGLNSGPSMLVQTFILAENWPTLIGFDFFDVDRAIEYGTPPSQVQMVAGDFDEEAIVAAFTARDYTADARGDLTLLCSAAGCEEGQSMNLDSRNPAIPFGGQLGRQEVLLLAGDHLVNSPDHLMIEAHIEALNGETDTLADNGTYLAAAEAAAHEGMLIQATIAHAAEFGPQTLIDRRLSPEQVEAIMEALAKDFVPIPQFDLVVIADAATETEQVATLGLVYASREDAEAAVSALPQRIESYTSMSSRQSLMDLLADRGATYSTQVLDSTAGDAAVALVVFRAPLAGDQRTDGRLMPSSMVYRLLVQMLYQRDLGWLSPALPE